MKKLLFLLLVVTCLQLKAQSSKLSQATINEFSQAVQAKYKASPLFKANMDSLLKVRYPRSKPLPLLRTMDKDTKVLDDVMDIIFLMGDTTASFRKIIPVPAGEAEVPSLALHEVAEKDREMTMEGDDTMVQIVPAEVKEDDIFTVVEQPPTFKGGNDSMMRYIESHIRYPKEAIKQKISGKVFVMFVINKTGKIEQVKTVGSAKGGGLEEEAIRVISAMPDWNPGKQNNKFVMVQYTLPVKFTLP